MVLFVCKKCKKIVWPWGHWAEINVVMKKSGKRKNVKFCFDCAVGFIRRIRTDTDR